MIGAIAGVAIVGGGFAFGAVARSRWHDAEDLHAHPDPALAAAQQTAATNAKVSSARHYGDLSTGFVIGGAAIAAAGAYFWITTHGARTDDKVSIVPEATPDGGGLVVSGRF